MNAKLIYVRFGLQYKSIDFGHKLSIFVYNNPHRNRFGFGFYYCESKF